MSKAVHGLLRYAKLLLHVEEERVDYGEIHSEVLNVVLM